MTKPHSIRLHGPWQYELAGGEAGTIRVPGSIVTSSERGTVSRRFNWVAAIEAHEQVFVVFTAIGGTGTVELNEARLGAIEGRPAEFEVTALLQPGNLLRLSLRFDQAPLDLTPGVIGSVRLEIRTRGDGRNVSSASPP